MASKMSRSKNKFRSMHMKSTRHRARNTMNNTRHERERHGRQRKSISFDHNQNKVRFVNVPPRSQNKQYWFSESARIARKGFSFELEPDIAVELSVDCRVQLTTMAQCREQQEITPSHLLLEFSSFPQQQSEESNTLQITKNTNSKKQSHLSSSHAVSPALGTLKESNSLQKNKNDRCFVEISEPFSLFAGIENMYDDGRDDEEDILTSKEDDDNNSVDHINQFSNKDNTR